MEDYRKKPVVIQAEEWTGTQDQYEALLAKGIVRENSYDVADGSVVIPTLEGEHICSKGDMIIKGVAGEHYPCKPDIFAKTYDKVSADEQPELEVSVVSEDFDLSGFKQLDYQVFPSDEKSIYVQDDPIYGGAHVYAIKNSLGFNNATGQAEQGKGWTVLKFVYKPEAGDMMEGVQSEQLAYVLLDRVQKLNAKWPSEFNETQKAGVLQFLNGCVDRVRSRMKSGVMGLLKNPEPEKK